MRTTLAVKGARENNLRNIDVEIPRDRLVVITGMSGSGKSSLAFETIYAEGQRRFLESLSTFAKRFVSQLKKPKVDFVYGLSPVVSIDQKTVQKNPRSTVGTMTDLLDYLRMLYGTLGVAHCPYCRREVPTKSASQMAERLLSLPPGTQVEIRAPVSKIYGEDYSYLWGDIRTKGYRRVRIDGELFDISEEFDLDENAEYRIEVVVDRFLIKPQIEKQLIASLQQGLVVGEGFLCFQILGSPSGVLLGGTSGETDLWTGFACPEHAMTFGEPEINYFTFNLPVSACVTCSGLGTYLQVHPDLLVPDKSRSIRDGAFVRQAYHYDRNLWSGRIMHSLALEYGFSLDTPFKDLAPEAVQILFYGTQGRTFPISLPEGATQGHEHVGKRVAFDGIIPQIERRYRHYRKQETAHTHMEEYLRKVMVEHTCPDCGGTRLKPQRLLVTLEGRTIHDVGELNLSELRDFLGRLSLPEKKAEVGGQILHEILSRLDLLLGIGLDYLNLNRPSATLSGGESQRIRLSTQIGSGLMGMLYVLDEPSIGLHPMDNYKMIRTLQRLRDLGNTVIVVEHDEETMRAADHILELGPGPGVHGGQVVAQGSIQEILGNPDSLTGQFLSGARGIPLPQKRRTPGQKWLRVRGARENNLQNLDVAIPLGLFVCVTGASGSGKSTLVNEIVFKKLYSLLHDSRVLAGEHDALEGHEHLSDVINIDQSPIGRSPRSNPATYIGFYDAIRAVFAETPEARKWGYTASRFSFNVKGGRCEECAGEGVIVTKLHFMPDVEVPCPACKGARYNSETLEVAYRGKSIAEVLAMTIEEGVSFFADHPFIRHKLDVLNQLGLGYLQLGHPATILSGGEAQRVKLARELGKIKRGAHNLYILDEPTTGLHFADIQRLLDCLNRLVDAGNTVLVIEHHLDVVKTADYLVDLGPEGGHRGGRIMAVGTPEEVMAAPLSFTGRFLKRHVTGWAGAQSLLRSG